MLSVCEGDRSGFVFYISFICYTCQLLGSDCWDMGSESVKVVVRCRPLNDREKALSCKMVLSMDLQRCQCFIEKPGAVDEPPKQFTFDGTYYIDQATEQMYNEIAYPLVEVSLILLPACRAWLYKRSKLVTGHLQPNISSLYLIPNECRRHCEYRMVTSMFNTAS